MFVARQRASGDLRWMQDVHVPAEVDKLRVPAQQVHTMPAFGIHFERFVETHLGGKQQRDFLGARSIEKRDHLRRPAIPGAQRIFENRVHPEQHPAVIEPAVAIHVQPARATRDERADRLCGRNDTVDVAVDMPAQVQPCGE